MVNVSPGWRQSYVGMTAQAAQDVHMGQDATTRTMACPVCKALYTPAPAHQQLVLAPHIVLESAFMSMCHFCFRCRRAACPDCWDAVHGICGACVTETKLPFRTQVKALNNAIPPLPQEQQVTETPHAAPALMCIQHGKFYVEPGKDDGRPQGATPPHHPTPVPTMSALSPRDRHSRDGGGAEGWWGPLRASVLSPSGNGKENTLRASVLSPSGNGKENTLRASVLSPSSNGKENPLRASVLSPSSNGKENPLRASVLSPSGNGKENPLRASVLSPSGNGGTFLFGRPSYSKYAEERDKDEESEKQPRQIGWITDALGAIEQWLTGALLVLLLTIITMIVLAEASPSANTQIMHILQIDIRSEVAYLIQLIGQL